jgi:hypothetical protein
MSDYWKKKDWNKLVAFLCALAFIQLFSVVYETYINPKKNDERPKLSLHNSVPPNLRGRPEYYVSDYLRDKAYFSQDKACSEHTGFSNSNFNLDEAYLNAFKDAQQHNREIESELKQSKVLQSATDPKIADNKKAEKK